MNSTYFVEVCSFLHSFDYLNPSPWILKNRKVLVLNPKPRNIRPHIPRPPTQKLPHGLRRQILKRHHSPIQDPITRSRWLRIKPIQLRNILKSKILRRIRCFRCTGAYKTGIQNTRDSLQGTLRSMSVGLHSFERQHGCLNLCLARCKGCIRVIISGLSR